MTDEQQPRSSRGPAEPAHESEPAPTGSEPGGDAPPAAETQVGPGTPTSGRRGRGSAAAAARQPAEHHDELPWIDDPVSRVWVLLLIAVFGAIIAYGVLFGRAGLLNQPPAPEPTPIVTPAASPGQGTPAASPVQTPDATPAGTAGDATPAAPSPPPS
jgi:hypothetical protein